jgi:hypothetical protein
VDYSHISLSLVFASAKAVLSYAWSDMLAKFEEPGLMPLDATVNTTTFSNIDLEVGSP